MSLSRETVLAVERAYVASATSAGHGTPPGPLDDRERWVALAAIGAVASRYLAVGTPRTLGTIVASDADAPLAELSIEAHATWFSPRELRRAVVTGSPHSIAQALACDIVCVHTPIAIRAGELRRGTHVNLLAAPMIDEEVARLATIVHEVPGLGRLAAGLVDGRQLDEITIFIAGDAAIALAALPARP